MLRAEIFIGVKTQYWQCDVDRRIARHLYINQRRRNAKLIVDGSVVRRRTGLIATPPHGPSSRSLR